MIIARIDNEITARTPHRRGRSFKGALGYLLSGSREQPNPERVLYAETVNILSDLPEAAHEMAATWEARFRLMQNAGLAVKNGADNTAPVYHLVMSWTPEEDPPAPQEMADNAKQLLSLLGLAEHEAVLVVHGDTANPHIHIIVNTVHPVTGRTAPLRFDKRIMQGFAARYEEMRNKVVCRRRFAPDVRSAFNAAAQQGLSCRRESRPRWARANGPALEAKRAALPSVVLEALTRHSATFSPAQLAQAATASTSTAKEFSSLMTAIVASPELVKLADDHGATKYTTRTQQTIEERVAASAARLTGIIAHGVSTAARMAALSAFAGPEQTGTREALAHLLDDRGLSVVVGYAGAGKSTLLKAATDAWVASGYRPRGLALAGRAAEGLEADAGIPSGTIASFLMALDSGALKLTAKDILVVDEAGMVASRQLDRVLFAAREAGAKVVLVGDPEQLQAIEAGGPFRYIVEHYDHARLTTVWRQKESWMRAATRALAEGGTTAALADYERAGMVHGHATGAEAIGAILDMWLANREREAKQLILTATNADARRVNETVRARLMTMGALGPERILETEEGPTPFAVRDRVVFRRNDRKLAVKNGSVGTVMEIAGTTMAIALDTIPPRIVRANLADYPHMAHGYAVTIHKSQGATVDRAYVLAAPNMDRHSAYVALSRHREQVSLHWSQDAFNDRAALARSLSRKRLKDVTLDYKEVVTERMRDVMANARRATGVMPDIDMWARLYAAQRAETATYAAVSTMRRAFWMAANLDRFLKAGAMTLEKLHERERAAYSAQLRATRKAELPAQSNPRTGRAKPTAAAVLGITFPPPTRAAPRPPNSG